MKGIFSPDSKFMIALNSVIDAVLLNLLFVLCSVPVVTSGAALSALYTAARKLDGSYPAIRVFFRAFKGNLKRMIPLCVISLALVGAFGLSVYNCLRYDVPRFILIGAIVFLVIFLCFSAVAPLFYSVFECTLGQLFRNVLRIVIAWPIRSLIVGAFTWLPIGAMIFLGPTFLLVYLPIVAVAYYILTVELCAWLYKMPITICKQQFFPDGYDDEGNAIDEETEEEEEEEAEAETPSDTPSETPGEPEN